MCTNHLQDYLRNHQAAEIAAEAAESAAIERKMDRYG